MIRNGLKSVLALALLCTLPATARAPDSGAQWRKAAWAMRSLKPPAPRTGKLPWGQAAFLQPVALAEAASISAAATVEVQGMPLSKGPATLSFAAGSRYYRVLTAETGRRIYCGADSGYSAKSTMIKVESRLCLSDDNGDSVFDQLLLATISRPAKDQPPLSPIYLLGLDNPSYQPLVVSGDPSQKVSIPFTVAETRASQFFVGPAFFRKGSEFAVGMLLANEEGRGTATTLFDPATDGTPAGAGMPATLAKRPQFKHMRKIDLSRLPATIELSGATLIVRSVDAEGAEIEVVRDFTGQDVPVAFSGVVAGDR